MKDNSLKFIIWPSQSVISMWPVYVENSLRESANFGLWPQNDITLLIFPHIFIKRHINKISNWPLLVEKICMKSRIQC